MEALGGKIKACGEGFSFHMLLIVK